MHKPWLAQYPAGVPAEIDAHQFASLKDVLACGCARFADLPAYSSMGTVVTYRQLDEASRAFAAWLQKVARLQRGDRVALMLPNLLQYPVALFGVLRAGMVVVNTNPLYTPRELEHQLKDAGATAIVVLENVAHTLAQVIDATPVRTVVTTQVGDLLPPLKRMLTNAVVKHVKKLVPPWQLAGAVDFNHALAAGRAQALDEVELTRDDLAFLQYTGGTTGVAKGAMLTHGNMVANVLQVAAWMSPNLNDGEETLVIPLPLYHVFALTGCLSFFSKGAQTVLVANPRDMPAFLKTLRQTRFTAIIGVNTLFRALLDAPGFADVDLSHLKLAVAGGMAVQRVVAQRWKERAGVPLVEGYGLTETAPVAIANPVTIQEWSGQIGVPLPSTEAAILDDDGAAVESGQVGEICLRGPQVMKGYWQAARRDRQGGHRRRLAAHRRHGPDGRARQHPHHRPQEGHDRRLRVQGVPQRSRGRADDAPRRAGGRRDRRARRALGRGGQGGGGAQGPCADRKRRARALQAAPDRLQDAAHRRVPQRAAAQDQHRQDPAAGVARRRSGTGGGADGSHPVACAWRRGHARRHPAHAGTTTMRTWSSKTRQR